MKIIEVLADAGHTGTLAAIAAQHEVVDIASAGPLEDGRFITRMLVPPEARQKVIDALQTALSGSETARINILPVEATLPRLPEKKEEEKPRPGAQRLPTGITREELYNEIEKGARLDLNYFLMVIFSTVVAAIGLIEDNVAVVIGAMVIAPLLGPNLAFALGAALGDGHLIGQAVKTGLAGLGLAFALSVAIGLVWPLDLTSKELIARTDVGLDSVALALASGAAAVLSLTAAVPTVLVGVMVAVALLPPTAALGLMLGAGYFALATGAGLLLAVNIVSVNLAAKIVFLARGVRPRTWYEKQKAHQSMVAYLVVWVITLLVLIAAMYVWQRLRTG